MGSLENRGVMPIAVDKDGNKILNDETKKEKINIQQAEDTTKTDNKTTTEGTTDKKKKRIHKKYKTAINLSALKELEGTTANSFLDLAKAVIMIDNDNYNETYLPLSKARKNDFKRLIEHYAVITVIGKRKYYIKQVYSKKQKEELNELEINSKRDNAKNNDGGRLVHYGKKLVHVK